MLHVIKGTLSRLHLCMLFITCIVIKGGLRLHVFIISCMLLRVD